MTSKALREEWELLHGKPLPQVEIWLFPMRNRWPTVGWITYQMLRRVRGKITYGTTKKLVIFSAGLRDDGARKKRVLENNRERSYARPQ